MNNNFKISPFVQLNLLTNGKPTYISVFDIQQIFEDTSGRGQEGVRIVFPNDEYTFVEGPLDKVMYAIDEVLNPDFYKEACDKELNAWEEESRRIPDELVAEAASILKRFCKSKASCVNCPFVGEDYSCKIGVGVPSHWEIPKGGEEE